MKLMGYLADFFNEFIERDECETNGFFTDIHMHTPASDGFIKPEYIKDFLSEKKYLVSITDHNAIESVLKLRELGINCVPGIELGCQDGFEILVYFKKSEDLEKFYVKEVESYKNIFRMAKTNRDIYTYLEILKEYDCHISIPHISGFMQKNFLENKSYIFDVIKKVDSIEIHNNSLTSLKNKKAFLIMKQYNKTATFGSDAHIERELKSFYNLCNNKTTEFSKLVDLFYSIGSISSIGEKHLVHFMKSYKYVL